ncbi:MAG: transposase [Phycisphaerales bacterium]|nr:MAG: transposase [Phycisphaerales bacterium]
MRPYCCCQRSKWLQQEYPSAAGSLLEGLEEMFTINRLGSPKTLRRCLGSTNVIESPNSGIRRRTRRVTYWRDRRMVVRWVAASLLDMEKRFKRIMGYE